MKTLISCVMALLMFAMPAMAGGVFYVAGDVVSPGKFPATGKENVRAAISQAGGYARSADRANVRLVRDGRVLKINDTLTLDSPMRPGDRLVIYRSASR